jgi:hypothetical protein
MRTLILASALALSAGSFPALARAEAPAAAKPPKGFDQKNAKDHLLNHQNYPATKAQLVASCSNLVDFSAADKKWFSDTLPEGSYASAAAVMKALNLK